jgi:hypothetical protein
MLLGGAIWAGLLVTLVAWSYGRHVYRDFRARRNTARRRDFARHDAYSASVRLWP